ncbi:AMP-binding protein [Gracilibacillus oryzae]|uniref:AMP-binding protein n=1 Tax=Gracilibacillus oryzae TaxID=1672701 RepID=A0A7C8GS38_9BACI|nr:AMP-binding protein [Gracilibacillus oryzae]
MFTLLYALFKIKLLSPMNLYRLIIAIQQNGINPMLLLDWTQRRVGNCIAIVDDDETITYHQLFQQTRKIAYRLRENYQLQTGQKVAVLGKNSAALVKAIFAVSRLGADVYLLNAEMSKSQFQNIHQRHCFDFIIYDREFNDLIEEDNFKNGKIFTNHDQLPAINNLIHTAIDESHPLKRCSAGKLILQTSGTTGVAKNVAHKPSLFHYLHPFLAYIQRLKVLQYQNAYVATPLYHGYGIAVMLLYLSLGKKLVISRRFESTKACNLIYEHQIEMVTVVPLMLQKMLQTNPEKLKSLVCIASGGAKLPVKLVEQTREQLGDILYNLYGTSETGFNFIAVPEDLKTAPKTLGKKIDGLQVRILDDKMEDVAIGNIGQFCVNTAWSMINRHHTWIMTGDLGYCDKNGLYFFCGRTDDMIVSGGENVYPIEVEQVLIQHPFVEDVVIIGMDDQKFGQRLKAFVLLKKDARLSEEALLEWLRPRVARYQLPGEVKFVDRIPYTNLGKLDRKKLN